MKIKYLGHSSFLLKAEGGATIVTDPYSPEIGFAMPSLCADAVTISHHHFDHDYIRAVECSAVFDKAGSFACGGVEIEGIPAFHDDRGGALRGSNVIFKMLIDGLIVCHLGDLGEGFSEELIKKIGRVDVLLIPIGGNYTIDARTAKAYADALSPAVIIPMHFYTSGLKIDIADEKGFLSLYGNSLEVIRADGEVELTSLDVKNSPTKIIIMNRSFA